MARVIKCAAAQRRHLRRARRNPALRGTCEGIPADQFNLTPQERALLPDPDWVTEDDADAIISQRRLRTEKPIPLETVLKRYGYPMED